MSAPFVLLTGSRPECALSAHSQIPVRYTPCPCSAKPRESLTSALAGLYAATGIAIALDESITCARDLELFGEVCSPGLVVVLKAARVGGPSRCLKIAELADAMGVSKLVITDSLENSIGASIAVHLATALSPRSTAVGLGGARLLAGGPLIPLTCGARHGFRPVALA